MQDILYSYVLPFKEFPGQNIQKIRFVSKSKNLTQKIFYSHSEILTKGIVTGDLVVYVVTVSVSAPASLTHVE
jgi:hypothetical protein